MTDFEAPPVAFAVTRSRPPGIEIRVNFGILAGREATPAEIDELGRGLLAIVPGISIVAENHYEIGPAGEAVVHLVKLELDTPPTRELEQLLSDAASRWAQACAAERRTAI
jgi:hypothetical protein